MDSNRVEEMARKAGISSREYCLSRIAHWKAMLEEVSDDYRNLSESEIEELMEREVDSYVESKRDEKND